MMAVHAVVLAGGRSARLGRPKQLELWDGVPLLRRTVNTVLESRVAMVHVVLGYRATECLGSLEGLEDTRLNRVLNAEWEEGMAASIRRGVLAARNAEAVLILPCDLPLLTADYLDRMVERYEKGAPMVASTWDGNLGPPALFGRPFFGELSGLVGDQGAKRLFQQYAGELVAMPFAGGAVDVDTVEDVERMKCGE